MIEAITAILIFGILSVSLSVSMGTSLNLVRNDRNRSVAANLASQEMDTVRSMDFTDLQPGQVVTVQNVDTVPYTITRESEWVSQDANAGACDAPQGFRPAYLRVNVEVSWPSMTGVLPVDAHTIVTPPVGTYDPNSGHIAVRVVDRDGAPASAIPVTITGPQNHSQITGGDGCAFFAFLPAGAYTTGVSEPGYVSDQGVAAPTQDATVTVGATTSILFMYDQAATLSLTLIGKDAGGPAPAGVAMMLANTHILPSGTQLFTGSGSPRTITGLFPYADGYEAWVGDCADADPVSYPGGSRGDPLTVQPGQTTSASVLMPEIRVTVLHDSGGGVMVPVPDLQVDAVHAAGTGCASGETFAIGQTDVNGQLLFALPYGTWQVNVQSIPVGSVALKPTDPPGPYDLAVTQ